MIDKEIPTMLRGDKVVDDRGSVSFVNQFDFENVKRFYTVRNHRAGFIRAWHGHRKEGKYVLVVQGTVKVKLLNLNSYDKIHTLILSEEHPGILWIPSGFYNGFKTLTEDAIIQFFSTSTLEESKEDDLRLPWDTFGKEIWEEEYR
jgi:dTDP-4-dehydrorhamnose 3,5-epimerase